MTVRHAATVASVILLTPIAGETAGKNPYAKLFTGATVAVQQRPFQRETEAARPEKPKVVCGTVLVPADASVDPRMRKSPPANDTTKHTMRVVKPPMCTSE